MKRVLIVVAICLFSIVVRPIDSQAIELTKSFFLKITVIENGIEYQWEYTNPGEYEFEKGEQVIKGEQAKKEMEKTIHILALSEHAKVEEMVEKLTKTDFPKLERLDIRWMTGENKLYTWVWDR